MAIKGIVLVSLVVFLLLFSGCLQGGRTPNPELCEKITQQQNRDICYHRTALTNGDGSLCGKIIGVDERDNCYMDLAAGRISAFVD
jgi:hypothetical protein